jgi:hypothetical protein
MERLHIGRLLHACLSVLVLNGGCSGGDPSPGPQHDSGGASFDDRGICIPDCSSATCLSPKDTCGGECPGVCARGEPGCKDSIHCQVEFTCIGYADGTTTCLPSSCAFTILMPPRCGSPEAECGKCPECTPQCENRECGPDPNCGQSCGTCAGEKFCSTFGTCLQPTCDPPIMVPDGDGGMRPLPELDGSIKVCPGNDR